MNEKDMLSCVSLLLGKTHGAIVVLLTGLESAEEKLQKLSELEGSLRKEIERLYYSDFPKPIESSDE